MWAVVVIRAEKQWQDEAIKVLRRQGGEFHSPGGMLSFSYREECVECDKEVDDLANQVVQMASEQDKAGKRKALSPKESEQKRDKKDEEGEEM